MLAQILLVFAFVFAVIAALFVATVARAPYFTVHFGWLAVAFYLLSLLLGGFGLR